MTLLLISSNDIISKSEILWNLVSNTVSKQKIESILGEYCMVYFSMGGCQRHTINEAYPIYPNLTHSITHFVDYFRNSGFCFPVSNIINVSLCPSVGWFTFIQDNFPLRRFSFCICTCLCTVRWQHTLMPHWIASLFAQEHACRMASLITVTDS